MTSKITLFHTAPLVLVLTLGLVAGCDQASGAASTEPATGAVSDPAAPATKGAPTGDELEHTGKPGESKPTT